MDNCIFCKIIKRKLPAKLVFESEEIMVFPDINPSADVHLLIVPKQHIEGIGEIGEKDAGLLSEVYNVVNKLVIDFNLENNLYRVVVNGGLAQHVPHLHFHLLGGNWKKMV